MPSIKQTLLREPTRSYQSLYQDGQSRPSSVNGYAGSVSNSTRRGGSSIRSTGSYNSLQGSRQGSVSGEPAWVNGQWEWSNFGGRRGLTGGARSLYTPSVVGKSIGSSRDNRNSAMSLRSERLRSDDGGSIRSERSNGGQSVRSTMSLPNGPEQKRRSSSRDILQAVEAVGREPSTSPSRRTRTQSAGSPLNPAPSSSSRRNHDNFPSISSGLEGTTSRRYASAPLSTSTSSRTSPSVSPTPISSRPSRSKSPLRHPSDDNTPSLTSSASSAPSSPPATPIHSTPSLTAPIGFETAKSVSRKGYQSPEAVLAPAAESPLAHEITTVSSREEPVPESEPSAAPRRFYSVDEVFAIAGDSPSEAAPSHSDPSSSNTAEEQARTRTESDNTSFATATDVLPPSPPTLHSQPSVPRLKLTRTESDQSRAGIKGAVDLSDEEDNVASTGIPVLGAVRSEVIEEEQEEEREENQATNEIEMTSPEHSNSVSPTPSSTEEPTPDTTYEVIRSSGPRRSASTPAASSLASDDQSEPRSYASSATTVSQMDSNGMASVDVPDWLQRIRALGDPIDSLEPGVPVGGKKKLTPPPHWTVLQLRAQEQQNNNNNRPNMVRPRSVGSLRSRKSTRNGLPDVAEEEEPPVPAFPAWLPKKAQDPNAPPRAVSPSPNADLSRASSIRSTSSSIADSNSNHRRTRSMDLAPNGSSLMSPLHRALSVSSTSLSRSPSRSSTTSSKKGKDDKPKRASWLSPPLASSKAIREPEPEPEPVVTQPRETYFNPTSRKYASPIRTSSLREALSQRDGDPYLAARQQDDAASSYGGSQISMMSAPQLSPVRPPRNPARRSSLSVSVSNDGLRSSARSVSENERTSRISSINYSPVSRPTSRPASIAAAGTEERRAPPPAAPIFPPPRPTSLAPSRAVSLSSGRPASSYLPPVLDVELSSLAISPRVETVKKTSKRFSLFRSSSTAKTSATRRFDPSLDLLYERVDAGNFQKRLKNDEVLIESIAVGLDSWDIERTWSTAKTSGGAGWVPGRAVYGKVLARGEGISRLKKGDLVWGLTTLKKSSTLASLVTLPRDNVSLAPSLDEHSLEEIASLPADAVTAMQVMESFAKELPKGSKILILNAHQGIGYLCLQLARYLRPGAGAGRDLWVVAQVPMSVIDGEALCKDAGATDVLRDEPLSALNGLHEGSFDVVIDTIGGRRLYDASRRVLHNSGSFVSTVGDSLGPDAAAPPSNYQTSLRSLRRTFFKKDKKSVSYWLASHEVDERESIRDVLDKVKEAVEVGGIKAKVGQVLSFSEARLAFGEVEAADGAGAVVRIKEL